MIYKKSINEERVIKIILNFTLTDKADFLKV